MTAVSGRALTKGRDALVRLGAGFERIELGETARACAALGAVLILAAILFLFRLGSAELCSSNEAVEGLVIQQMVEHGDVLSPMLNGHAPMFKPPLFHWTATALAHALGVQETSELTVRLPSVLFALACVLLTMLFVRSWLGLPNAVLSGLVLLGSYQYVTEARFGRVDMALTFCEALALFAFLAWLGRRDAEAARTSNIASSVAAPAHYLFAVALGIGVLAKGPVGMLLPLAAALVLLVGERRWKDLRALSSPGPVLVFLALATGWYLACLWGHRLDLLQRQIIDENVNRFTGGIHTMAPLYYLKPLLLNSAPLSMLVPIAVVAALRAGTSGRERAGNAAARDVRPYVLALFWVLTIVFFSVAAYKRRAYLLPLWPAAAALLVWWLDTRSDERRRQFGKGALAAICGGLIVFNLSYIPHAERRACGRAGYRRGAAAINAIVRRREPLYLDAASTESAPLLFYLDRNVPVLDGALADAPKGYVLVPESTWALQPCCETLRPRAAVTLERLRLILVESRPDSRSATHGREPSEGRGACLQ